MIYRYDDDVLRTLLALGPDDTLVEVGRTEDAVTDVEEGLAVQPQDRDLDHLIKEAGPFVDVFIELSGGRTRVKRGGRQASVLLIEGLGTPTLIAGEGFQVDGSAWAVDARSPRTLVLIPDEEGDVVLAGGGGSVVAMRVVRSTAGEGDPLARGLRDLGPYEELHLEVPSPDELCEGLATREWLLERARRLYASADLFERVASVGLVARFAAATADCPADVFHALVSGRLASPTARARDWAAGLDTKALDELERLLLESTDVLRDDLHGLAKLVAQGGATARRAALVVCWRRDELESVAWVLVAGGREDGPRAVLEAVDTLASRHLTSIDLSLDPDDDLLSTVAWQSPDAWWGAPRGS